MTAISVEEVISKTSQCNRHLGIYPPRQAKNRSS